MRNVRRRRPTHSPLGLLLALPAIILLLLFLVWPIAVAGFYSTTSASGYGDADPVGLQNYGDALQDPALYASFGRNLILAAIVVGLSVVIGYVLAFLLFMKVRGWRALQVLYLIPYVTPHVVAALVWVFLLEPENGLVNNGLRSIGLGALAGPWLTGQETALVTASLVQAWIMIPFAMLLIFGGMLGVDPEVLEASQLDGAGRVRQMVQIVFPIVRPVVVVTALFIALQMFRSFDVVYLLTQGGPIGATTISTLLVFVEGFVNNRYGYANAIGVIVGLVIIGAALAARLLGRSRSRALEGSAR